MKIALIAFALVLLSGLTFGCSNSIGSKPADSFHGENANWKIKILSATRGQPAGSKVTGTFLNVELEAEYTGSAKDAPFEKVNVSLNGKDLAFVAFSGNIMERMQGKKFKETYSFDDPGPDPASTPRQFTLKYSDVPPINFTLMDKKPTNANQ